MGGKRTVPLVVDQVIRQTDAGRYLNHIETSVYPVFLDLVLTALGNRDLRLKRGVILIPGPGIMEAANKGAYFGDSPSIGLNIQLPHEQRRNAYQDVSQTFRHFFARKYMFVKLATAYVVLPGGFGTLDELMEALTLVQTGKTRRMPIILVGSDFWRGMLDWLQQVLITEGMIAPEDMDLVQVIDEPAHVVEAIFKYYETRGFEPSPAEREVQLNL